MAYQRNAHNPSNVPPEHYQKRGWRLMDADEVGPAFVTPLPLTRRWYGYKWKSRRITKNMWTASSRDMSYLTKLSRNRIRFLRGLSPERFPPDVPAPYTPPVATLVSVELRPPPTLPPIDHARIDIAVDAERQMESYAKSHSPIIEPVLCKKRIRRLEW